MMIMYPALAKQPLLTYFSISYINLPFFLALHYAHLEVFITGTYLEVFYNILRESSSNHPSYLSLFKASKGIAVRSKVSLRRPFRKRARIGR